VCAPRVLVVYEPCCHGLISGGQSGCGGRRLGHGLCGSGGGRQEAVGSGAVLWRRWPRSGLTSVVLGIFKLSHVRSKRWWGCSDLQHRGLRQGGRWRGQRWITDGWRSSEPTLPGLSSGEGFRLRWPLLR
jgi:hypothetical protein